MTRVAADNVQSDDRFSRDAQKMSASPVQLRLIATAILLAAVASPLCTAEPSLSAARNLYLGGNYAEAGEMYGRLAEKEPVAAAVGQARCLAAVGKTDEAGKLLAAAAKNRPGAGAICAEIAILALDRGDYKQAEAEAQAAINSIKSASRPGGGEMDSCQARCRTGRLDEAQQIDKSLVDLYNASDEIKDPDALRYIGLAAARFARWNRLSDQFHFLVNDFYPDILKLDKDYWPAHYEAGLLYLEKYNQTEAAGEFHAALAINPQAAEVHAALASLALQNYDLAKARASLKRRSRSIRACCGPSASGRRATGRFRAGRNGRVASEDVEAQPARRADARPAGGRLCGARWCARETRRHPAGPADRRGERPQSARRRVLRNSGRRLGSPARYPDAARFYRAAIDRMPQLVSPRGELGMVCMRLGNEVDAAKLLHESFEIDPFNVRVSNTLKVLDVLSGYSVIETDHFIVKFDRSQDEILAHYAADYLEHEVYPQLVKKFGFQPAGKSLFEIFNREEHRRPRLVQPEWSGCRISARSGPGRADGGDAVAERRPAQIQLVRVLRHEFVHVVNLQQTHFNVPHWFTEALAVQNEGFPRPRQWNELLVERVPKGDLFNLETINGGFIRPKSSDEWALAYCQAELYADYMLERFGPDAVAKMLAAYADNVNTHAAIRRSFGIEQAEFEKGYLEYLHKLVAGLGEGSRSKEPKLADLEQAHEAAPDNLDAAAKLALAYLRRDEAAKARTLADHVLEKQPHHQLAGYVVARLLLKAGEQPRAINLLENCLSRDAPQENLLSLLAGLKLEAGDNAAAAELYELGSQKFPQDIQWLQASAGSI